MSIRELISCYGVWGGLKKWERNKRYKLHPHRPPGPSDEVLTLYGRLVNKIRYKITCFRYPYTVERPLTNEAIQWCYKHYRKKYIFQVLFLNKSVDGIWRFKTKKIATHFKIVWG